MNRILDSLKTVTLSEADSNKFRENLGLLVCQKVSSKNPLDFTKEEQNQAKKLANKSLEDEPNGKNMRKRHLLLPFDSPSTYNANRTAITYWRVGKKLEKHDQILMLKLFEGTSFQQNANKSIDIKESIVGIVCDEIANKLDLGGYFKKLKAYHIRANTIEARLGYSGNIDSIDELHLTKSIVPLWEASLNNPPYVKSLNQEMPRFDGTYPSTENFESLVAFSSIGVDLPDTPHDYFTSSEKRRIDIDLCPTVILGDFEVGVGSIFTTGAKEEHTTLQHEIVKKYNEIYKICEGQGIDFETMRGLSKQEREEVFEELILPNLGWVNENFYIDYGYIFARLRLFLSLFEYEGRIIPIVSGSPLGFYNNIEVTKTHTAFYQSVGRDKIMYAYDLDLPFADELHLDLSEGCRPLDHPMFARPMERGPSNYTFLTSSYRYDSDGDYPIHHDLTFKYDSNIVGCQSASDTLIGKLERHILSSEAHSDSLFGLLEANARKLSSSLDELLLQQTNINNLKIQDVLGSIGT